MTLLKKYLKRDPFSSEIGVAMDSLEGNASRFIHGIKLHLIIDYLPSKCHNYWLYTLWRVYGVTLGSMGCRASRHPSESPQRESMRRLSSGDFPLGQGLYKNQFLVYIIYIYIYISNGMYKIIFDSRWAKQYPICGDMWNLNFSAAWASCLDPRLLMG